MMTLVRLQTKQIVDWPTFHDTFAETFGFPSFYGRNMNAWIDCMSWLDDPSSGMTSVHAPKGGIVVLQLEDVDSFADRCLAQFQAIIDGTAFVNWRRIESGEPAVLALSYYKEVCPFNRRRAALTDEPAFQPRPAAVRRKLADLACMTEEEFRTAFKGSPVKRAKWRGLLRNAAAALSSRHDDEAIAALEHALHDPDEAVRQETETALLTAQQRGPDAAEE